LKYRNRVLGLLSLLLLITQLDRVCISVAGPRMQEALHIGPVGWGWVTGMFTLSYGLFEIPTGALGDRLGPRKVLTRIVLWWSAFTAMTGMVSRLTPLLVVRFLFGIGEAGAYPNASIVVARWCPVQERGRAFGVLLMAGQLGAAFAPLLVVPLQMRFGWRAPFLMFCLLGPVWALCWYRWFRDSPAQKAGITAKELAETAPIHPDAHPSMPWAIALRNRNVWAIVAICFCYIDTYAFFSSWMHTYLEKGRGFQENDLWLSSLPFLVAALANFAGGYVSNVLIVRIGPRWGRCAIGVAGLVVAAGALIGVMLVPNKYAALGLLTLALGGVTFQQPIAFAVCLDVGGAYAGAMVGIFNTASGAGGFLGAIAFGYLVKLSGGYTMPFVPMAALLMIGAWLWMQIDPRQVIGSPEAIGSGELIAL
jgi:ACS family glucarate transporter-like MFS transporter